MLRNVLIAFMVGTVVFCSVNAEAAKFSKKPVTGNTPEEITKACKKQAKKKAAKKGLVEGTSEYSKFVKNQTKKCEGGSDKDGVADASDNCPADFNNDQADTDSDGVGNVCDNCVAVSNADQANSDADALGNACDNCPAAANDDQADADNDGKGNVCEICDVIVTSDAANYSPTDGLYVFRDVLGNASNFISPDVEILDTVVTADLNGIRQVVSEGNLFAITDSSDAVFVYADVTSLTDNQEPNLTLDFATSGLVDVTDILLHQGDLYVGDSNTQTVRIFRDIALDIPGAVPVAPDVILTNATADITSPHDLFIDSTGRLWVADESDDEVLGFNNASAIAADVAPDVRIDGVNSTFIDDPRTIAEVGDCLYVLQGFESDNRPQLAFCPVATIATDDEPDWVGNNGYSHSFGAPKSIISLGDMTWLGLNNGPGIAGFKTASPPQTFAPTHVLGGRGIDHGVYVQDSCSPPDPDGGLDEGALLPYTWLAGSDRIATCGGVALVGAAAGPCYTASWNSITAAWVYTDPNGAADGALPDKVLWHPFMDYPKYITVIER